MTMSAQSTAHPGPQPQGKEVFLDHIAHWVPEAEAAANALTAMGFALTPFSEQRQNDASGNLVPAGAGNRCVMLERGYLEFLTPLADTPIGAELKAGIARYIGVHIGAFAVADTAAGYAHMQACGVEMRPLAQLQREVEGRDGATATARFTVARPQPGQIPEGRVQMLTHHTPEHIWQRRYVQHANGALGLAGLLLGVEDIDAAAARYAELLRRAPVVRADGVSLPLDQGSLYLTTAPTAKALLGAAPVPPAPCMVSYVLECRDLPQFVEHLCAGGAEVCRQTGDLAVLKLPASLGASIVAIEQPADVLALL